MIEGSATVQQWRLPVFSVAPENASLGNILLHQPDAAEALELQRTLRTANYRVIGPASSGADVQRFVGRSQIDCAVIDARAGFELGAFLDERDIPFVVISGDVAGAVMWRAAGRILIPRPYRAAEVLRAIQKAQRVQTNSERGSPAAQS